MLAKFVNLTLFLVLISSRSFFHEHKGLSSYFSWSDALKAMLLIACCYAECRCIQGLIYFLIILYCTTKVLLVNVLSCIVNCAIGNFNLTMLHCDIFYENSS